MSDARNHPQPDPGPQDRVARPERATGTVHASPGRGILGIVAGKKIVVGNLAMLAESSIEIPSAALAVAGAKSDTGATPVFVAADGVFLGSIFVADPVRATSREAITRIGAMSIATVMLTGDVPGTAAAVAAATGIGRVVASVTPAGKLDEIRRLQAAGKCVVMVGDGINDAPALAGADVGIAVGGGTDVAAEAGGVVLVGGDPLAIPAAIRIARRTMRVIKQNLFWAFGYNVICIPLAAGIYGVPLSPIAAGAAMAFSSVSVVLNSLRLRNRKN